MKTKYWFPGKYRADLNMQSYDMVKLLTGGRTKLPAAGIAPGPIPGKQRIDGVVSDVQITVLVTPAPQHADGRKNNTHRVMAVCPGCGDMLSAGRLFQHVCGAK